MSPNLPILYSFRRCPYAMRARMALLYTSINVELREVVLRDKPPSMLAVSAKGTVPVLQLADGRVLDQSLDIMHWALADSDPRQWRRIEFGEATDELIAHNDGEFKTALDRYKYWERFPAESQDYYRAQGELFLAQLESRLSAKRYLFGEQITLADVALFPFVRQFAFVDKAWFDQSPYPKLRAWLDEHLASELFVRAMKKSPPWQDGDSLITLF